MVPPRSWDAAGVSELERRWSRRTFLVLGASLGTGFVLAPSVAVGARAGAAAGADLPSNPFTLGVGSGDPDATSVVLWTRLTGMGLPESIDVTWEAATAVDFAQVVASGTVATSAAIGHAVHVTAEIDGPVIYRFSAGGFTSPIGRAAPVPAEPTELRARHGELPELRDRFLRRPSRHRRVGSGSRGFPR